MAGAALRRLMAEHKQLSSNPPEGIFAGPVDEENFLEWEALITGPEGTCWEGGIFPAKLVFPTDYPLSPPKMKFNCDMFHPNVYADGRVCISILTHLVMILQGMNADLNDGVQFSPWKRFYCRSLVYYQSPTMRVQLT